MATQHYQADLAYIHHVGFSDLSRNSTPYVLAALRRAGIHDGTVVELGCGTGILLSALSASGYRAVGVDSSPAMLELASATAPAASLVQGSLYDVSLPPCRAIIAVGEPLNYMPAPEAIPPLSDFLARVATALTAGGLLLFDVMVRGETVRKPYRSWLSGADWACLVEVAPQTDRQSLRRAITTFRLVGDAYRRGFEEHWVHLFSRTQLSRQLKQAGFVVRTTGAYGQSKVALGRLVFHCIRACA